MAAQARPQGPLSRPALTIGARLDAESELGPVVVATYKQGMPEPFVELSTFPNALLAEQARDVLEDEGIPAVVEGAASGTWMPGADVMGLIRVLVPASQAETAARLLAELRGAREDGAETGASADVEEGPNDEDQTPGRRSAVDADDVEAWAKRTRRIAAYGLLLFWCLIGAILRVTSPPHGIEESPAALRDVQRARDYVYASLVLHAGLGLAIALAV